jgi:hypothetical protein
MGFIRPKRIQIKLLKPDLTLAPHLVVGLFPEFESYGGGEHDNGSPKV